MGYKIGRILTSNQVKIHFSYLHFRGFIKCMSIQNALSNAALQGEDMPEIR